MPGFLSTFSTVNLFPSACFRKTSASSRVLNFLFKSALNPAPSLDKKSPLTLKNFSLAKALISFSLSTIKRTATDCTLPADKEGCTLRQRTGDSSKPTKRSRTRRACWASTNFLSILCGVFSAA